MKYTPEMLTEAARKSTTIAGVLRILGIPYTGGAHSHIKRRLADLGIDTTHFTGRGHYLGRPSPYRLSPEQVLVIRPPHRRRAPGSLLTKALIAVGVPHRCAVCGVGPEWNGNLLVLHVDHITGDYRDCRRENLRFLCPNCHSQTSTFAGRGKRPPPRTQLDAARNRPPRRPQPR